MKKTYPGEMACDEDRKEKHNNEGSKSKRITGLDLMVASANNTNPRKRLRKVGEIRARRVRRGLFFVLSEFAVSIFSRDPMLLTLPMLPCSFGQYSQVTMASNN